MVLSPDDLRRIDEEANRFEASWRAGHFPKIEDFVAAFSARLQEALFRELLLVEVELRNEDRMRDDALPAPNKEEYLERFPSRHDVISEVIPPNPFPDEYRFLRLLGSGGHGKVWRAWDVNIPRSVVLKNPRGDRDTLEILRNEAEKLAQVRHPNVVQIHAWRTANTDDYLVMEFVKGGSLNNILNRLGRFPWDQATRYIADVGEALKAVHSHDIVHRDIKPANMLWDDQADEVRLTDFGCAVRLGDRTPSGTIPFMAPEVLLGQPATPLADVYSLAATLFCLVTGKPPFVADSVTELEQLIRAGHPRGDARYSAVPAAIEELIRRGLDANPDMRIGLQDFVSMLRGNLNKLLADSLMRNQPTTDAYVKLQLVVSREAEPGRYEPIKSTHAGATSTSRDMKKVPKRPHQITLVTGDYVRIEVIVDQPGFVTVFNIGPTGSLNLLHPERLPDEPNEQQAVGANQPLHVLDVQMSPPTGSERLFALWTRHPLPLRERDLTSLAQHGGLTTTASYNATRNMKRVQRLCEPLGPADWQVVVLELEHVAGTQQP